MADKKLTARQKISSMLGVALVGACATMWHYTSEQGERRVTEAVDSNRFQIQSDLPGSPCDYVAEPGANQFKFSRLAGDNTAQMVAKTLGFGSEGHVRLYFDLPKAADLASVEVRNIQLKVSLTPQDPEWAMRTDSCGGGEYSRNYAVGIYSTGYRIRDMSDTDNLTDDSFDPLQVTSGEHVFLDYSLSACARKTFQVQFDVTTETTSGERHTLVPKTPITVSGKNVRNGYIYSANGVLTDPFVTTVDTSTCRESRGEPPSG